MKENPKENTAEFIVYKTTDYSIFKEFTGNREIDEKHVRQIIRKILEKNLLPANPIIVNHDLYVIDGQHRLEAAKKLKEPIYYLINNLITREDISRLNTCQKNWKLIDYVNFWTIEKKPAFTQLSQFISKYEHLSISVAISLLNSGFVSNIKEVAAGNLDIDNIEYGYKIADCIVELYRKYQHDFIYDSRFPKAFAKACLDPNFDFDTFIRKIEENPRAFVKCLSIKDSKLMVQDIYNRNVSKNKIAII